MAEQGIYELVEETKMQIVALQTICGGLLAEIAAQDENPPERLQRLFDSLDQISKDWRRLDFDTRPATRLVHEVKRVAKNAFDSDGDDKPYLIFRR